MIERSLRSSRERDTITEEILTRICSFPSIIGCSLYLIKYSYLSPEPIRLTGQRDAAGLDWFLRNAAILLSKNKEVGREGGGRR